MANLPHKYSQEAQDERDWRATKKTPKSGNRKGANESAFKRGYDEIDWGKKKNESE